MPSHHFCLILRPWYRFPWRESMPPALHAHTHTLAAQRPMESMPHCRHRVLWPLSRPFGLHGIDALSRDRCYVSKTFDCCTLLLGLLHLHQFSALFSSVILTKLYTSEFRDLKLKDLRSTSVSLEIWNAVNMK